MITEDFPKLKFNGKTGLLDSFYRDYYKTNRVL